MYFRQLSIFELFRPKQRRVIPPTPSSKELLETWHNVRAEYFPDRPDLDSYVVTWSKRGQLRTLASCNVRRKRVVVAREMQNPECIPFWEALLYHEMCHAFLGEQVPKHRGKRQWHGRDFRTLEKRHPGIPVLMQWVRFGGWFTAVKRDRSIRAHQERANRRLRSR